jgi:hypothetical protein
MPPKRFLPVGNPRFVEPYRQSFDIKLPPSKINNTYKSYSFID